MSQNVAPWLQGLDADITWDAPVKISSASHDASALTGQVEIANNSLRRVSRRSSNGSRTMGSVMRTSVQRKRSPLTAISGNDHAADSENWGTTKLGGVRSASTASSGSVLQCGTVQQRPKSASPPKKQETLEWKRRLMRGQLGYGDQTDLFGPSGLENIFAQPQGAAGGTRSENKSKMAWTDRNAKFAIPSSPPTWNAPSANSREPCEEPGHRSEVDQDNAQMAEFEDADSQDLSSDPFAIESSYRARTPQLASTNSSANRRAGLEPPVLDNGGGDRTVSGRTELEQEDFSPVFVSKHTTTDGQIDYQAFDSHKISQFQQRKVSLQHSEHYATDDNLFPNIGEATTSHQDVFECASSDDAHANPDLSLSENLPTGTPVVLPLDDNVQLRRGGYSNQGSFKARPLSSSDSVAGSGEKAEQQNSKLPTIAFVERDAQPSTPYRGLRTIEHAGKSSGSPLKLFGTHDTFTNNRLLRRMSELNVSSPFLQSSGDDEKMHGSARNDTPSKEVDALAVSFGSGNLDEHGFEAELPVASPSVSRIDLCESSPASEISPPGSKAPTNFRFEHSPIEKQAFRLRSKIPKPVMNPGKPDDLLSKPNSNHPTPREELKTTNIPQTASNVASKRDILVEGPLNVTANDVSIVNIVIQKPIEPGVGAGKRPPNSPCKDSTPKRRRTLHASELLNDSPEYSESIIHHAQDSAQSRKRKDARQGDATNKADPDVLSSRKLLQPRSLTPKQLRRQQIEAEIREVTEDFAAQEPGTFEAVMEQIESSMASNSPPSVQQQARTVANEVAKFTLRVQKASGDHGERKRSVTTQDFFNEAVMVMKLIREKAARQYALGSVAESDQERMGKSQIEDYSDLDNSALSVSRPPSREGAIPWRPRTSEQTNARVISHLRKFQESDDNDPLAPSFAELHLDDEQQEDDVQESEIVIEDEESNIRIRGPRVNHQDDFVSPPESQRSHQEGTNSVSTVASATVSTGRTQQTSSTRKSENVGTLAPDAVAHLIGEQVGSMTYDKQRQQWVKLKHSPKKIKHDQGSFLDIPSSLTASDDDPFREISDLPVDEQKEEQIRTASYDFKRHLDAHRSISNNFAIMGASQAPKHTRSSSQQSYAARPATRDSNKSHHTYTTADATHLTALGSSQAPAVETRATSWANDDLGRPDQRKAGQQQVAYDYLEDEWSAEEDVDQSTETQEALHEESLPASAADEDFAYESNNRDHDDEVATPTFSKTQLQRNFDDESAIIADKSRFDILSPPKLRQSPSLPSMSQPSILKTQPRQISLRRKTLTSRFHVEQREEHEVSFVANLPGERTMSVSVSVSRPVTSSVPIGQIVQPLSSPSKLDPSFMFSELPEFTISGEEEERPSERQLATRLAQHAAAEVNDRYALAVKDLVKTLTDVHETELYWDDVKTLNLHGRSLASLHGLSDFCGGVQCMDVSNNTLNHLDGAPSTIRMLCARSNQISNLTSWNHLANLQYLDISGNRLTNLNGIAGLVHLRELRADNNEIESLDALHQMDGLLKVRLGRNKLVHVDFTNSRLQRLEDVDLSSNQITSIYGLDNLIALNRLKLDENKLDRAPILEKDLQHMQTLSLRECGLRELDVSRMPGLRVVQVDGNSLQRIDGMETLKSLDVLSIRSQSLDENVTIAILGQANHARTINLSGNDISTLSSLVSMLSLQHLEMASVGMQVLPDDFGIRLPNLKTLNLNFNALRDIRPLLNIQRLEQVDLCGNRLGRLRKSIATLSRLPTLRALDLRDNPLTQGFYAAHGTVSSTNSSSLPPSSIIPRSSHAQFFRPEDVQDEERILEATTAAKFRLAAADTAADKHHHARLDAETKLRRRVHQVLLATSCRDLARSDGLPFDKESAMVKDEIWTRLVELGIVRKSGQVVSEA
jgi:Leucine-rich repeat (LRR) protein